MFGLAKEAFEYHGNVQVKLEFYLDPTDYGYDKTYIDVPDFAGKEYKGKTDKDGNPDPVAYQEWIDKLPKKKQLNPFHSHFVYLPPEYSKSDIENEIAFHLPNFYKAWSGGKSMRSGWATEKRIRPVRFDKVHPELYAAKKEACLDKIASLAEVKIKPEPVDGKVYPATDIDVGSAAINRASSVIISNGVRRTAIDYNNPANDSGVIDTVEAWFSSAVSYNNFRVGIFDNTSSANFTCRDGVNIGRVYSGSKQTYTGLSLDIETGDYIGCDGYNSEFTMDIERDTSGGDGVYYSAGAADSNISCFCDPGDTTGTLSLYSGGILSLYGSGETAGWSNIAKVNGIASSSIAKVNGIAVASIAKINGVAV